jgi:hypothetical protein
MGTRIESVLPLTDNPSPHRMLLVTGLLLPYKLSIIPLGILTSGCFSMLFYPEYYPNQSIIWTADLVIGTVTYGYMILWKHKDNPLLQTSKLYTRITLLFYWLFILYWIFCAVLQFSTHTHPTLEIQGKNILMSTAWWFFFSTMAYLYYTICITLLQRSQELRIWLKSVKNEKPSLDVFFKAYNAHYKIILQFSKYWNFLVFLGFCLLGFHIPIDLISVIYAKNYYDSFGLSIKTISLGWYIACICKLNDIEPFILNYLYKHRIYSLEDMTAIEKYIEHRPLGLDFYGIKINKGFIIKILLLILNLIIPTVYGLISNSVFG